MLTIVLPTEWTKKKGDLENNGHNSYKIHQKGKKEMAKKNKLEVRNPLGKWLKIHCIIFVPFLEGGCQLQVHFS